MSQKNETTILVLALLVTISLVGASVWWLTRKSGVDLGGVSPSQTNQPNQSSTVESFAKVQNVPSGLFNYGGSTTWAPIRKEVDPVIQTVWTQFQLRYTQPTSDAPGSGTGIKMLLNNQLAFSQSSRSITNEEYQQASQRGLTLKEIPIAIDGIAVAVNPNLNIKGLTIAQLKDIYTGKLTNWNQVNGPNLPITAYSRRKEDGGTIEFFVENILGGAKFGTNVKFIPTTTQALRELANNLGGIYYASAPEVVPQCGIKPLPVGRQANELISPYKEPFVPIAQCPGQRNQLNVEAFKSGQYPITRRLFVIVKQNGQDDQRAGEAYSQLLLTTQGQQLISKAGFVGIRSTFPQAAQ
jgi:phosphate transport system substrate-binding protein